MTAIAERRLEWLAEHRFLTAERHRIERRLAELDEILSAFPEKRHG